MKIDINTKKLLELFDILYVPPNEGTIVEVLASIERLNRDLELLNKFDVEGVEPMFRIASKPAEITILREDKPTNGSFSREHMLKNVVSNQEGFVRIGRVVGGKEKR